MEKKESAQEYIKVWSSEMWHGKSLQVACMFLPEDCPLFDHIIKSYKKQIEEAEEIAALNLAKYRKVAGALGDAEAAADQSEQALARMKARARSASLGPM